MGNLSLLQRIFSTQGSNLGLLHCQWVLYQLSHQGSPNEYACYHNEYDKDQPQNTLEALDKIHSLGCKAGIVLKPKTPAEAAIPYLEKCDMILVMTVEPGFGGQKFMADQMGKVKQLRQWMDDINPDCHIEVDGGVDANTHSLCKENGADVLVAGSAYFKASDRTAFVKLLQE